MTKEGVRNGVLHTHLDDGSDVGAAVQNRVDRIIVLEDGMPLHQDAAPKKVEGHKDGAAEDIPVSEIIRS